MPSEATQFRPGQSGNPGGRPRTKPFAEALRAELAKAGEDQPALREIAASLITEARNGNLSRSRHFRALVDSERYAGDSKKSLVTAIHPP
jgi:hypothetical protein